MDLGVGAGVDAATGPCNAEVLLDGADPDTRADADADAIDGPFVVLGGGRIYTTLVR